MINLLCLGCFFTPDDTAARHAVEGAFSTHNACAPNPLKQLAFALNAAGRAPDFPNARQGLRNVPYLQYVLQRRLNLLELDVVAARQETELDTAQHLLLFLELMELEAAYACFRSSYNSGF